MAEKEEISSENILRILVATDNHLGYGETDAIRGEDSFTAFEEILQIAVEESVDMILLGGDLFHDAVPSQNALNKCMKLLRCYTFGDKPIPIEILSDQKTNFHSNISNTVNYEDPNINVSIPVFSIHGNHDDPSGFGRLSSLDLLSTTGLVNYFGRWTDLNHVNLSPLLLKKGETQLAIYGLSHIHDGRLARLFENYQVTIQSPSEETGIWFHLMVIHQNRADRGPKNYLAEDVLPNFLNLVIWGHEHDCRIQPEYNAKRDFYVSQPGSSVATSLSEGEATKKHVGLLEIYKNKFNLKPIPLQTVRPFVFESINLVDLEDELRLNEGDESNKVKAMAEERVKFLIEKAKELLTGHPNQPTLPLIRLRIVFSSEEQMFNAIRFGQTFNEKVANPADIIHFKKIPKLKTKTESAVVDKSVMGSLVQKMNIEANTKVEDLVCQYFEEIKMKKPLYVVPAKALSEMSYRLVERRDNNAADNILKFYKEKGVKYLLENLPNQDSIKNSLISFNNSVSHNDLLKVLDESTDVDIQPPSKVVNAKQNDTGDDTPFDLPPKRVLDDSTMPTTSNRGRPRGRGGAATGARGKTKSKKVMPELNVSVNQNRSLKQNTLLNAVARDKKPRKSTKIPVYEVSDSDSN